MPEEDEDKYVVRTESIIETKKKEISFCEEVQRALSDETNAKVFYDGIITALKTNLLITDRANLIKIITEIANDEADHHSKFAEMYNKECGGEKKP